MSYRLFLLIGVLTFVTPWIVRAEDRDTAAAFLASAEKSFKANDLATAKSMCERALNADKTFAAAHFQLGQVQEAQNQPKDAIHSYQTALDFAKKENNAALANKAMDAAKRLGPGLLDLGQSDQQFVAKMYALGEKALSEGQLDTAKSAFAAVLALAPTHETARDKLTQTEKAIEARGDPVQAKIAAAALAEVWYQWGTGNKADATKLATDLSSRFKDTAAAKEAVQLLANNFAPPKHEEIELAKKALLEQQKKQIAAAKPATPSPAIPASETKVAPSNQINVEALEKTAQEDAKKLPKEQLAAAFQEALTKGKEFYSKATPGTEGNQKNLASALEQFIRCEAMYLRLEELKMIDDQIQAKEENASMLRYACMKMTILSH